VAPVLQVQKQRDDTIKQLLLKKGYDPSDRMAYEYFSKRMYSRLARMDDPARGVFSKLQGMGDLEPLRTSRDFSMAPQEYAKYDNARDAARHEGNDVLYSSLTARKLAEGRLWPTAAEPTTVTSRQVPRLRCRENMSESARKYCTEIEYFLRRDFKKCPAHVGEHIDFEQFILKEVIGSRRSRVIYIVWCTVDPAARFKMEPQLLRLQHWVRRVIFEHIKHRPNIPRVVWIYDGGEMEHELPRRLLEDIRNHAGESKSTVEERVAYLKKFDTVETRMRNIPWFMPYLWSKEQRARQQQQVRQDYEEMQRRQAGAGSLTADEAPRYVK
jgi:hypothetical protein